MNSSAFSRLATEQDLGAIIDTLTVAFEDDPVWGGWAFPDRRRAGALRRTFFRLWMTSALRHRWVRVTQGCEAVAAWYPPGEAENTVENERQLVALAGELLGDHAGVFLKGGELFDTTHPRDRPHYYLSFLGTRADHRGKGLGMALLRDNLALIDAQRMPAYLESSNPGNLPRYERLGFTKVGEFILPSGGPKVDTLWREPAGGSI